MILLFQSVKINLGYHRKEGDALPSQNIGQYLQKIRKSKHMTQSEVAKQLNVSPQAVSKWECNDSMPDIALLPEIAKLYNIGIDDILTPKDTNEPLDNVNYHKIISEMNRVIDNRVFHKLLQEFKAAGSVKDLSVPPEIFMFLNNQQKEQLFTRLFEMKDYGIIIDDIIPYTNLTQRMFIIQKILEKKDYEALESLIPFTPKSMRTKILKQLLNEHQFLFLEKMLPFLNHEHKDMIINYATTNHLEYDIIENYIVFFDSRQRETIQRWYTLSRY